MKYLSKLNIIVEQVKTKPVAFTFCFIVLFVNIYSGRVMFFLFSLFYFFLLTKVERKKGSIWVIKMFFVNHFAIFVFTWFSLYIFSKVDSFRDFLPNIFDPYMAIISVFVVYSFSLANNVANRIQVFTLTMLLVFVLYANYLYTVKYFYAVLFGFLLGYFLNKPVFFYKNMRLLNIAEKRLLVALCVAAFAVGPIFVFLTRHENFSAIFVRNVLFTDIPSANGIFQKCLTLGYNHCDLVEFFLGRHSIITFFMSSVPTLFFLLAAEGLRRGRRLAYLFIISIESAIVFFSFMYMVSVNNFSKNFLEIFRFTNFSKHYIGNSFEMSILPIFISAVIIVFLLTINRKLFFLKTPRRVYKDLLKNISKILIFFTVTYYLNYVFFDKNEVGSFFSGLLRQYLFYPLQERYEYLPENLFALMLFIFSGPIFWATLLLGVFFSFFKYKKSAIAYSDKNKARHLLYLGGSSLSWMVLWKNNHYWFSKNFSVGISYQLHDHVVLSLGGPFGDPLFYEKALDEFVVFCEEQALVPCFYSVDDSLWQYYSELGFKRLQVAEETVLNISDMNFSGKKWQNVRTAFNKANNLEIKPLWFKYVNASNSLKKQIDQISQQWVSGKNLPEMNFTLGGIEEIKDEEVLCFAAVDNSGVVHGVTSWLPVFREGKIISWTLDFIRRSDDAFKGITEFMVASAISEMKQYVSQISLSGSPLVFHEQQLEEDKLLPKILLKLGNFIEPMYGFKTLAAFKHKFQPEYKKLYLVYGDNLHLPNIAKAVLYAYLPNLSQSQIANFIKILLNNK